MDQRKVVLLIAWVGAVLVGSCGAERESSLAPEGEETTTTTDVLKAGSALLQGDAPLSGMDVYLVGFHPMKQDPLRQIEAHHYCRQVNQDFAQCALFDGNRDSANLNGIEYIISERLFEALPQPERQYWHPHNYEILSGQLVAPALPDIASEELMRGKMNSYGKTFHLWSTDKGDELPMGEPTLAWSFNRDGEAKQGLVERRDEAMGIDTAEVRRERQSLVELARPQEGVDALRERFPGSAQSIDGVFDKSAQGAADATP